MLLFKIAGIAAGFITGGRKKAKDKALDLGVEMLADKLGTPTNAAGTPAGPGSTADIDYIESFGRDVGLRLSGALKKAHIGFAEDAIRDRIKILGNAIAVGVDLDDG